MPAPTKSSICAVMVTHHPDGALPERVACMVLQLSRMVIVDNNSAPAATTMLTNLSRQRQILVIRNSTNRGIATALNQGMEEVVRLGYPWALLLDQDTLPFESMVPTLSQVYEVFPAKETIALIGSNYIESSTQRTAHVVPDRSPWIERPAVITSGSLVSTSVFRHVGPFRDELFIDEVDIEYCLRVRARGFKVLMTCSPVAMHSIGAARVKHLLWREVRPSNHTSVRWYYMTRNRIAVARQYWRREPRWVAHSMYSHLKMIAKVFLYEDERASKGKQMVLGAWHGLRGRLGER